MIQRKTDIVVGLKGEKMADVVIREWTDEKGWIHRIEIPLKTFLREHDFEAVVRCKDCKHNYNNLIPSGEAEHGCTKCIELPITADFYCSRGEREEDGTID